MTAWSASRNPAGVSRTACRRFDELRTGLAQSTPRLLAGHRRGGQVVGLGATARIEQAGQGQKGCRRRVSMRQLFSLCERSVQIIPD